MPDALVPAEPVKAYYHSVTDMIRSMHDYITASTAVITNHLESCHGGDALDPAVEKGIVDARDSLLGAMLLVHHANDDLRAVVDLDA